MHELLTRNGFLFREVNERIDEVNRRHEVGDGLEFLCECGRGDCRQPIALSRSDYDAVRSADDHFLVAPGHERPGFERVVAQHERHVVVESLRRTARGAAPGYARS